MEFGVALFAALVILLIPPSWQKDPYIDVPFRDNEVPLESQYYLVDPGTSSSVCLVLPSSPAINGAIDGVIQLKLQPNATSSVNNGNFSTCGLNESQFNLFQITQPCQPLQEGSCVQLLIRVINTIAENGSFFLRHTSTDGTLTDVNVRYGPIDSINYVGKMPVLDTPIPIIGGNDELPFEVYLSGNTALSDPSIVCEASEENPLLFNESVVLTVGSFMPIMGCTPAVGGGSFTQPYSFTVGFFMNEAVDFSPLRIKVKIGGSCDNDEGISSSVLVVQGFGNLITTLLPETTYPDTEPEISTAISSKVGLYVGVSVGVVMVVSLIISLILLVVCCKRRDKNDSNFNEEDGIVDRIGVVCFPNNRPEHETWRKDFAAVLANENNALLEEDISKADKNLTLYVVRMQQSCDTSPTPNPTVTTTTTATPTPIVTTTTEGVEQQEIDQNSANNSELVKNIEKYGLPRDKVKVLHLEADEDGIEDAVPYTNIHLSSASSKSPASAASKVAELQLKKEATTLPKRITTEPPKRKERKVPKEKKSLSLSWGLERKDIKQVSIQLVGVQKTLDGLNEKVDEYIID